MTIWTADAAKRWLSERGFKQSANGSWRTLEGREVDVGDLAAEVTESALEAPELSLRERLELGLGLLDLLDYYGVAMYLRFQLLDGGTLAAFVPEVWDYFREALEREVEPKAVSYSLWVDWFEDRDTVQLWFNEMMRGYETASTEHPPIALINRLRHVLANSGPVPWATKRTALFALASVWQLQPAVFNALMRGYHDFYGDLDRKGALELLALVEGQSSSPQFSALQGALNSGIINHYSKPDQWPSGL